MKTNTKNKAWQIIGVAVLCALCVLGSILGVVFGMNHSTEPMNVTMAMSSETMSGKVENAPLLAQSSSSSKALRPTEQLYYSISDVVRNGGSARLNLIKKLYFKATNPSAIAPDFYTYQLKIIPVGVTEANFEDAYDFFLTTFREYYCFNFNTTDYSDSIRVTIQTNSGVSCLMFDLRASFCKELIKESFLASKPIMFQVNQEGVSFIIDGVNRVSNYFVKKSSDFMEKVSDEQFHTEFMTRTNGIYYAINGYGSNSFTFTDNAKTRLLNIEEFFATYEEVELAELPPNPTKEGYTFTGWYYDEACTIPYNNEPIYSDTKLYAGWRINTFKVTFNSDGGSAVGEQTVDWNTSATLTTPTKEGYTFVGWFLPNGTQYTNQAIKADTTLTARWNINKLTVKFDTDGGNTISDVTIDWNTSVQTGVPTKEGYDFKGWYLADGTLYANQALKADTTLKAKWQIKRLTITIDSNGGNEVDNSVIDWNTSVSLPAEPTRIGYNFVGWFMSDGTEYMGQNLKSSCTITAKWQIKTYKITFIVDGEVYDEVTVDHGTYLGEIANQVGVYEQNVYAYRCESYTEPTEELGGMTIVGNMTVLANKASDKDMVVGEIKNNRLPIVLGVVGGIALISFLSVIIKKSKKKA